MNTLKNWLAIFTIVLIHNIAIATNIKDDFNITVDQAGNGDYKTIQDAINATKAFPNKTVTITIKNGIYNEKVRVYPWNANIKMIGENQDKTIITYNDYFDKINLGRNSTFHTSTLSVEADDFFASNLTIINSSGDIGQAIALSVSANRTVITKCKIIGNQDTLYATGQGLKQYFSDCYIEGTTDFIFGNATVVFENCIIHSIKDSYITAASTPENIPFGFVFINCNLTASPLVQKVYLGRPWRVYAKSVFVNCTLGKHILPEGWHNWDKKEAELTTLFAEYNSVGDGANNQKRVKWSHQLTKKQAQEYSKEKILKINNHESNWYKVY